GEIDGMRRAISQCWSVGSASTDTLRSVILVAITMKPDGDAEAVRLIRADAPTEAAGRTAFDIARRTILRCARKANLPPEKYETWREIEMEFDYNGMRLR
ncbi:MAG: cell envelope biogenesis protein TolA, partial [Gemmobacter sp.]